MPVDLLKSFNPAVPIQQRKEQCRRIFDKLSTDNQALIKVLFGHLKRSVSTWPHLIFLKIGNRSYQLRVVDREQFNKMSPYALATCVGPNLNQHMVDENNFR